METKAFEIRDAATFIPVIATRMLPESSPGSQEGAGEYYLLRRAGFPITLPGLIVLCRMEATGGAHQASYDMYGWGTSRTMGVAHKHIEENWANLRSGDVIDVEYILGETPRPKQSERFGEPLETKTKAKET